MQGKRQKSFGQQQFFCNSSEILFNMMWVFLSGMNASPQTLNLPFFRQLEKALAKQFGDNCEVVLHDLTSTDIEHSVVLVENGHVTHRHKLSIK